MLCHNLDPEDTTLPSSIRPLHIDGEIEVHFAPRGFQCKVGFPSLRSSQKRGSGRVCLGKQVRTESMRIHMCTKVCKCVCVFQFCFAHNKSYQSGWYGIHLVYL